MNCQFCGVEMMKHEGLHGPWYECTECGHADGSDVDCDCERCDTECPWCVDGEQCEEHGGEETDE